MKPKILVMDDDAVIRLIARKVIEDQGWEAVEFETCAQTLAGFDAAAPDLALLDVNLPDGSGYDVCRELRRRAGNRLPILFLTHRNDLESRLQGFSAGAVDYIVKPISPEELAARVRVHLNIKSETDALVAEKRILELRARAQQDLLDMVVHDLKTPLTSIRGTIDIIRDSNLLTDTDNALLLDISQSATETLLFMINDLLDLSRAGRGDLVPDLKETRLQDVLARLRKFIDPLCARHQIGLEFELGPGAPALLRTDPMLLLRILVNLCSNALKYGGGREILVCLRGRGGLLRAEVADRGPGVPDAYKDRIFEKYFRLQIEERKVQESAGIGLAFCRLAAQALKGRVWVEDREGGGSRFILEVPAPPPA